MATKRRALVERRKAAGLSQEALAAALRVEPSTVGRWERGETEPQPWCRPKLARLLAVSNEQLADLLEGEEAVPPDGTSVSDQTPEEDESLRRREFLKHNVAAAVVPGTGSDAAAGTEAVAKAALSWAYTSRRGVRSHQRPSGTNIVRVADVEALEAMYASLTSLDNQHGGAAVLPMATAYLEHGVEPLLSSGCSEQMGQRLFTASAQLTLLTGSMAYDAGRHRLARQHFVEALSLANEAGDRALGARVLTILSHQALHLGTHDDALVFARVASDGARRGRPAVEALCAATEARATAAVGDQTTCLALMAKVERVFARVRTQDAPPWLRFLDEAELAGKFGRCLRDLGLHADAERQLETSLRLHDAAYTRSRAITQLIFATNFVREGELEHACSLGLTALPTVGRLRSQRTREHLRDLQGYLSPYDREPVVRQFCDQARDMLASNPR